METDVQAKVCSYAALYQAMMRCKHGVMWKDGVAGFVKNAPANIYKVKAALDNGTYTLDRYTIFNVKEPKEREIVSPGIRDRVVQPSLCTNYLYDTITRSFIRDNHACQKGKGNEDARKRLACHMQRYYRKRGREGWVLKIDLKNFFGSTPHTTAMDAVRKRVKDPWAVAMIQQVVDSFTQGPDPEVGMGLGSEITQLIQLAVLDDLDHIIKERLGFKYYDRYNDDMVLIHHNKTTIAHALQVITEWLTAHGLHLNAKKTQIFPLRQGIRFLGFRIRLTATGGIQATALPANVSGERHHLKKMVQRYNAGLMTKTQVDFSYRCWRQYYGNSSRKPGGRMHRNCHGLILTMDQYYKNLWR